MKKHNKFACDHCHSNDVYIYTEVCYNDSSEEPNMHNHLITVQVTECRNCEDVLAMVELNAAAKVHR